MKEGGQSGDRHINSRGAGLPSVQFKARVTPDSEVTYILRTECDHPD